MSDPSFEQDIPIGLARAAHAGTSHSPDIRGDQERSNYASTLSRDFEALSKIADTDEKRATLATAFAAYRVGYRQRYQAMLSAKSGCVSTLISGRSNFPVARQERRSSSADKRTEELLEFRTRALEAIRKELQPELRPIMAGDSNALDRLREKLAEAEKAQAMMVAANKAIRKHAPAGPDAQIAALIAIGLKPSHANACLQPDCMNKLGFASYQITNNGAEIRRLKERIAKLQVAKATPDEIFEGEYAQLEISHADNRVRLFFPGPPAKEIRERLQDRKSVV